MDIREKLEVLKSITGKDVEAMAAGDVHSCKCLVMHLAPHVGWDVYHSGEKLLPEPPVTD